MPNLLIPCDGSPHTLVAIKHVIREIHTGMVHRIHLVNVQAPFSAYIARHLDRGTRASYHNEQANEALSAARKLLDAAGVTYYRHTEVGDKAHCIASLAKRLCCDRIVLSTPCKSGLVRLISNSLTIRLLEHSTVPIKVITANEGSSLERVAIPAGVGAGLTLLWLV